MTHRSQYQLKHCAVKSTMFKIDFVNFSSSMIPTLTTELIGFFSVDGDLQYRADLSQLKYYIPPPDPNNVNFDLKINFTSTRHRPTVYKKLDNILRWVSENFHRIERPLSVQQERWYVDKSLFR